MPTFRHQCYNTYAGNLRYLIILRDYDNLGLQLLQQLKLNRKKYVGPQWHTYLYAV